MEAVVSVPAPGLLLLPYMPSFKFGKLQADQWLVCLTMLVQPHSCTNCWCYVTATWLSSHVASTGHVV